MSMSEQIEAIGSAMHEREVETAELRVKLHASEAAFAGLRSLMENGHVQACSVHDPNDRQCDCGHASAMNEALICPVGQGYASPKEVAKRAFFEGYDVALDNRASASQGWLKYQARLVVEGGKQ